MSDVDGEGKVVEEDLGGEGVKEEEGGGAGAAAGSDAAAGELG